MHPIEEIKSIERNQAHLVCVQISHAKTQIHDFMPI